MGPVKVNFAEKNKFGILDHDVTLSNSIVQSLRSDEFVPGSGGVK